MRSNPARKARELTPELPFPRNDAPRILLADDHPVVRRHVRNLLRREKGWEVCAEATTGREAVAMNAALHPDIVVLDLSMPELNGLQAARLIHEHSPDTEMIILTMHESFELMDQMSAAGVRACILKTDMQSLIITIRDLWQAKTRASGTSEGGFLKARRDDGVRASFRLIYDRER